MKGYKVFNENWACQGFQYKVGETFEMKEDTICCEVGFHFCKNLINCFNYYDFNPANKVAEVEAIGDIVSDDNEKYCTNKIRIVREISWYEVLDLVNTGKDNNGIGNSGIENHGNWNSGNCNTGYKNTGDCNTGYKNTGKMNFGNLNTGNQNIGDYNAGDWNIGNQNTGDYNTSDWNTGDYNTGNRNTGIHNVGDRNTGNFNTGDWNTGNFNISNRNTGCFNTISQNIIVFNKPTNLTYDEYMKLNGMIVLSNYPDKIKFIHKYDMSDTEKEEQLKYKTVGGYLKKYSDDNFKTIVQKWWDCLSVSDKQSVMNLPNFNPDIFYECTWIKVN